MGKMMSAALILMLAGCGLAPGETPETLREREKMELQAPSVLAKHTFTAIPREAIVRKYREHVGVDIALSNLVGAEGKTLTALVGQMGCGISIEARGHGTITNGVAHITLTGVPSDMELALILSLDTDGDGTCTEADTLWSGQLITQQSEVSLALDVSTLEASPNWMCFAVNQP